MTEETFTSERRDQLRCIWKDRSLTELAEYILTRHHAKIRELVPGIAGWIARFQEKPPEGHQALAMPLKHLAEMLEQDLCKHLATEEELLFPFIRRLEQALRGEKPQPTAALDQLLKTLAHVHDEHDQIVDNLVRLKVEHTLARLPAEPGSPWQDLARNLATLFADLEEHVFLEDELLFPEAIELEKRLRAARR